MSGISETIMALVDEGMSQSEALRADREKKEKAMSKTATITRKVNQKEIKKIRVKNQVYVVTGWKHSQDGVEISYVMKNGKANTEFVERGTFSTRLITGYPGKGGSEEE